MNRNIVVQALTAGLLATPLAWAQTAPSDAAYPASPQQGEMPLIPLGTQARANSVDTGSHTTTIGISTNVTILTGIGLSIGIPLSDQFNLRAAGNAFSISREIEEDDDNGGTNTYNGKIKLLSYGLFTDWHPFHGAFRLTAGALMNGNKATLDAVNNGGAIDIGDCSYTSDPNNPLSVRGKTNFRKFAPYAGLGWGGNLNAEPGFYGTFDLGVIFSGSANVKFNAAGQAISGSGDGACGPVIDASTDPSVQAELAKDQADINESADKIKVWPVIGFGFGWRF